MTGLEKEKIINGIDVSECNAYKDKHCKNETSIMFTEYNLCSNFPNCYFKQFKRLQEENEELKARNANLRLNLATYDLPEIKKVLTDWRTGKLDRKFKKLQKENEKLRGFETECNKYHKALEKIQKMFSWPCVEGENCFTCNAKCSNKDVLNITVEVLNDRD